MNEAKFRCFTCGGEMESLGTGLCPKCQRDHEARGLSRYLLQEQRQFVIDKVKKPIVKALIILASRIKKEPTKQNTHKPTTHVWLDMCAWFFEHENNPGRRPLFKAIWKIFISENEHDDYYEHHIQLVLEKWLEAVLEGKWPPRDLDYRLGHWKEEEPGKGYQFIKERYELAKDKQLAGVL